MVPGLATLAHAKYIGKITYEGEDADKYELISTIPHQTRNETWVLKDTQLLAYMMHSNLSVGLTETFVFTDVQPVTDDDFSAPSIRFIFRLIYNKQTTYSLYLYHLILIMLYCIMPFYILHTFRCFYSL